VKIKSNRIQFQTLLFFITVIGGFSFNSVVGLAQNRLQPILPLQIGSTKTVPLVEETLRDPEIAENGIHSAAEAVARREQANSLEGKAEVEESSQRQESYRKLIELYASLSYYYADGIEGNQDLTESRTSRIAVIKHADMLAKILKNDTSDYARALYLSNTNRYLIGSSPEAAIKTLRFVIEKTKLANDLKQRAKFLVAIWDLEHGRNKEIGTLKTLIGSLPKTGAIAARLTLARKEAGINASGRKIGSANSAYKGLLSAATKRTDKIENIQSHRVLSFAIGVWRTAENSSAPWINSPIPMKSYADFPENKAIMERQALDYWSKGNAQATIKGYKQLSQAFAGENMMDAIDRRILDLENFGYQKTKKYQSYESAMASAENKYSSEQAGYAKAATMLANVKQRHENLVHSELASAATPAAPKVKRTSAIALANRYLANVTEVSEKEAVYSAIARLWILNEQHKQAVKIYLNLANEINPAKKPEYLALAAAAQRTIAKWPATAPWQAIPVGSNTERMALLSIYKDLNATRPNLDWPLSSHMGLLYIRLDQQDEAFKLWTAALKASAIGSDASLASGMMLADYQSTKQWQNLEDIARLCRSAKLVPIIHRKSVDVTTILALALLEGGKSALENQNFQVALKKLTEFVKNFRAVNRDEGMLLLAIAYRNNSLHEKSIETLMTFSEEYSGSKYFRQAMLNGGDWAVPMAFEESAMFFYELFLKRFSNDAEAGRIRVELVDMYIGRRLYAEAGLILTKQLNAKEISVAEKEVAALRLMRMEEKFGTSERTALAAAEVLKHTNSQAHQAEALGAKARQQAATGQVATLRQIEAQLSSMDERNAAQETLAETRFLLATANLKPVLQPINSLVLQDPKATISARFQEFTKIKKSYELVCESGETSYCVPALHRIARIAERLIPIIEDVTIPATLPNGTIKAFEKEKSLVINSLSKEAISADGKCAKLAARGNTNPDWIQQVYWQNSSDMNFERVSGEAGRAYFQWPVAKDD
jgi:hypothetical protein